MKKVLALILIVLMLVLSGCENSIDERDEISSYNILSKSTYTSITNLQSSVIVCVVVDEPIWDTYYAMYGDGYEYEFYGDEIEYIYIFHQGTLMIKFNTGEITYVYDYIAITFDV